MTEAQYNQWDSRLTVLAKAVSALQHHGRREGVAFCWAFADQIQEAVGRWQVRLALEEEKISPAVKEPAVGVLYNEAHCLEKVKP